MQKKLVKHGNSWALVIDKPILDLLKIDPETAELDVTTDGRRLVLDPHAVLDARHEKFEAILGSINAKYGQALKRLAE